MPADLRDRCKAPALPTDDELAALAAQSAAQRELDYWMPREADWTGALSTCDGKRAGAVAVSDAQNRAALELRKKLEGQRVLRGRMSWDR